MTNSQKQFLAWLYNTYPSVYEAVLDETGNALGADSGSWWQSFLDTAKEIVPVIVKGGAQRKLLKVQLKRAQQGLPPLKASQIAPAVEVRAGISDELKQIMVPTLIGAGVLLMFVLIRKKM